MEQLYKLKEEFLNFWSEEKVKEMTLEEYTNLDRENSFCYWLESKTTDLGSIWGGSAYKFGIYKRSDLNKEVAHSRRTDGEYAWFNKYGETKEEAFEAIKTMILQIIQYSQKDKLENIDKIDLGFAYKWKIAFLYGNFNIINIFKYEAVKYVAEKRGFSSTQKKVRTSELQDFLIEDKPEELDYFTYAHSLWGEYDKHKKGEVTTLNQKQLFINWLIKNKLNPEIAEELESLSDEALSNGYEDKQIYECIELYDVRQLSFESPISENWDNLYEHYYNFILTQIKEKTGINLFRNYGLVTVENSTEYDDFIKNNYWSGNNKKSYENYVNKFNKGSQLAIFYWDKKNTDKIKIGAIGTVIDNPRNGYELKVKWNNDFESFSVEINSSPNSLDFYQIEPEYGEERIEDIKNIFYKVKTINELINQPLNQILFGAPGTGKTYATKKIAVEIIDNLDYTDSER